MRDKIVLFCLGFLPFFIIDIDAQDAAKLEYEYNQLAHDMLMLGYLPDLPYHKTGSSYNFSSPLIVDVEDELTFAVLSDGYLKFQRPDGGIYYSRYIVLHKEEDGYYKGDDKCLSEITPVEGHADIFKSRAYFVQEGSNARRMHMSNLEIDEAYSVPSLLKAKSINTTDISPQANIMRMIEIINILRVEQEDPVKLYDFKEKILYKMLDIALNGAREAKRKHELIVASNNKFTLGNFWDCYDYFFDISFLCGFVR
ncbi:MAG: hypothetical protein LBK08_01565 [Treponema sp.]|jgi:hypothetical protein|nr:hypothetical protein [Treponema sp.]